MFRDVLADLLAQAPDIEIIGQVNDAIALLAAVGQWDANVVIMASPTGELPAECTHLFCEYPGLLVVVIAADTGLAQIYRQAIVSQPVAAETAVTLVSTLRLALLHEIAF